MLAQLFFTCIFMKKFILFLFLYCIFTFNAKAGIIVLQSDFGLQDGAVAEMKGVALGVDENLKIVDGTHDIESYNIFEGCYRLFQIIKSFPKKTVFVSIIDPGVGSDRKSIVAKTKSGHYIVSPDNGTITIVDKEIGIDEVREIDETINRVKDSQKSYTFYGRDVYVYTAAKLASGKITFEQVGKKINKEQLVRLKYKKAVINNNKVSGIIPVLDIKYGNVWTNINRELFDKLGGKLGDKYNVVIKYKNSVK